MSNKNPTDYIDDIIELISWVFVRHDLPPMSNKNPTDYIDDIIEFTNLSSGEKIRCLVTDLFKYSNFKELYKQHNKVLIGYGEDEEANPSDMLKYYPKEDVERFGVIGIEIKVI